MSKTKTAATAAHNGAPFVPSNTPKTRTIKSSKGKRKGLYFSYCIECDYLERKFVEDVCHSFLKEYNLENELWVDLLENCLGTSSWMSLRMENAEKCKGAVIILSNSYMDSRQCVNEMKTLLDRSRLNPKSVRIYLVLYEAAELSAAINEHITGKVDLRSYATDNVSEKVFVTCGTLGPQLEKRFCKEVKHDKGTETEAAETESESNSAAENSEYKSKPLLRWSVHDVQNWLKHKGLTGFHMEAFLEREVDGFLLSSLTEAEISRYLLIDNKHVVRKIPEMVQDRLKQDLLLDESWHYRHRDTKVKPSSIYLIFDPKDITVAFNMQKYFTSKGFDVTYHQKLGSSREEFLRENGPIIAQCNNFIVIISQSGATSPFVYNETVFVEWMERNMCSVLMRDAEVGSHIRPGLKAILQDKPSATLHMSSFGEDMEIVEYLVAPARPIPSNVVLQHEYVYMLTENIKFLADFLESSIGDLSASVPSVYISYQWDIQVQAYKLSELLQYYGVSCWADFSSAATPQRSKPSPTLPSTTSAATSNSVSSKAHTSSTASSAVFHTSKLDNLQNQIIRNIRKCTVVLCCFSEQYSHSNNCHKDIYTAITLGKPIIPLLLTNVKFPPEAPVEIKTLMSKYTERVLDLSTGLLLQQNLPKLVQSIKKVKQLEMESFAEN